MKKQWLNGWTVLASLLTVYSLYSMTEYIDGSVLAFVGSVLAFVLIIAPFWWAAYRTAIKKKVYWLRTFAILLTAVFALFVIFSATSPKSGDSGAVIATPASVAGLSNEVNAERIAQGKTALIMNEEINATANQKCQDMASSNYFAHKNPTTGVHGAQILLDRMSVKYPSTVMVHASENLAKVPQPTDRGIVEMWLSSEPHKEAMLDGTLTEAGYAICQASDGDALVVQHMLKVQ